ncbi:unnamed protein product [Schistosoma margrebowiei]|uniref:Uncharacterized protein n=1 Tax=Schistosoma margrebowiei TaxID=48269 RepID=A0A183MDB5_9TREM|nr:unnamed protein product [Schistosoma margrebowiei]
MEDYFKVIKEAFTQTSQEDLDLNKHHRMKWVTTETVDKINQRTNKKTEINNSRSIEEKFKADAEYIVVNKQVKKSIETDMHELVVKAATTAEKVQQKEL